MAHRSQSGPAIDTPALAVDVARPDNLMALRRLNQPRPSDNWLPQMKAQKLLTGAESQALEVLNRQPLRNVQMIGLIRDNGLEHPHNRGTFYGCFEQERLVGVALIGHVVFLSGNLEAVRAFARVARRLHRAEVKLVLGEDKEVEAFNKILKPSSLARQDCHLESQLFFAACQAAETLTQPTGLRRAEVQDLDEVAQIHAQACLEYLGVDPSLQSPESFRQRVLSRIRMGRIWIVRDQHNHITFKADVAAETDQAVYLEAIWTRPGLRGKGIGSRALRELCHCLLQQHRVVCLLAGTLEQRLTSFYRRVGFEILASYYLLRFCQH